MKKTATHPENPPAPIELLDRNAVLRFFGGSKPLHHSTLYRGVREGTYPMPVNVAPGSVRWVRSECEIALARMLAERGDTLPRGRGRPRHRTTDNISP